VEIRECEGEQLSSINDFRENSIKGPQFVNIEKYEMRITRLVNNPVSYTYDGVLNERQRCEKAIRLNCMEG